MRHLYVLFVIMVCCDHIGPISGGYLPPQDVPTAQEQIEELRQIVEELVKHQRVQDAEIAALKKQSSELLQLKDAVNTLRYAPNGVFARGVRHAETPMVAFSVALSHHLVNLGRGQDVVFDTVITNINNSYNLGTGTFVAPVPGLYVFGVTLLSYNSHNSHFSLSKNGQVVYRLYVGGLGGHSWDTSGSTVVVSLSKGDTVTLKNLDENEALWGDLYSTFSGFLLKTEYEYITLP